MKKFLFFLILLNSLSFTFSQNSSGIANKNTAIRYVNLAENCLLNKDFTNALKQANNGLSYDDSISDLFYIKAQSMQNLDFPKYQVLEVISLAFEKNNWVCYSKNNARILYASLLSDTLEYEKSNQILDEDTFLFTAESELIRIKNLYKMNSTESINSARQKVNSSRRVYPNDKRFFDIFFKAEFLLLCKNENYKITPLIQTISHNFIKKLPDYINLDDETEILSTFFCDNSIQSRLLKAINTKNSKISPLLAVAALESQIINPKLAFEYFVQSSNNQIDLILLNRLLFNIKNQITENDELIFTIADYFNDFNGILLIDENFDLQNELQVEYQSGRPFKIIYDKNNDDKKEFLIECDFGSPKKIEIPELYKLEFENYPLIKKINTFFDEYTFIFDENKISFKPVQIVYENQLLDFDIEFFIPQINNENQEIPQNFQILATKIIIPITERENTKIEYSLENQKIIFANFYENEKKYAYCDFQFDFSVTRFIDNNNDDFFETKETFYILNENSTEEQNNFIEETEYASLIFKDYSKIQNKQLYLKNVQIDYDLNTFIDFKEEFTGNGGKITTWFDSSENIECKHILNSNNQDFLQEETIFYKDNTEFVNLTCINKIPVKMIYQNEEILILHGENENVFWLEEKGKIKIEEFAVQFVKNKISGEIDIFDFNEERFSVIKIDNKIFLCKIEQTTENDF